MKSLGLQIENHKARYALVEHQGKRYQTLALDQCELNELAKIAKTAHRIVLGLHIATLKHEVVENKMLGDSEKYYGYYRLPNKSDWQQFSTKKIWVNPLLETLKKQGLRVRALDCQILAVMRLAKHRKLTLKEPQLWRLIEPNSVTLWQSRFSAIENSAVFYYHQHLSQVETLIDEYKKSLNTGSEI